MSSNPVVPLAEPTVAPVPAVAGKPQWEEVAAWIVIASLVLFTMFQHMVSAMIFGLTLYLILDRVSQRFARWMSRGAVRPVALLVVALVILSAVAGGITLFVTMLRRGAGNVPAMM